MAPFARFNCLLLISVCLASILFVVPARAGQVKPLLWGADEEGGMPYVFSDPASGRAGFEVDIAAALAQELNQPIEFKQYRFESLIPGLLKGDFDFAMNGLEITPERQEQVRFSKPYYVYREQLVVRKGEERFHTLKSCLLSKSRPVIGTMEGTAALRLLDQYKEDKRFDFEVKIYDSPTEAYKDLGTAARIDAVFLDLPMAIAYAQPDPRLEFAGKPTARGYYAIAFRPNDRELADQVDAALDRLKQDGRLREIYRKWGLWDEAQEELMPGYPFQEDAETGGGGLLSEKRSSFTFAYFLPLLGQAAVWTVALTVTSFVMAMVLGLPIALMRLYGPWWLRGTALLYIEFFRGVPVMLLLFFIYFGLPGIAEHYGWNTALFSLDPFWAATIGLGLNYAAYEAEIYRASVQAIPAGQWEAAASLGMPAPLTFRRIILPQALRSILPPSTGDLVALFKDTSIASTIGIVELTKEYLILSKSSLQFVEIGLTTAAIYLLMSVPLGYLSRNLEKRWGRHIA